jgi:hypothetical protein
MSIDELIERLEEYRDSIGGDAEVRLMTPSNKPFDYSLHGVCSQKEITDTTTENVFYLVGGQQLGFGYRDAWKVAK